jgi:hypothetical protein
MEALAIYEELQHPELGGMYNVMGGMYSSRYRSAPGFRAGASSGPQHGALGDKAVEFFKVNFACSGAHHRSLPITAR